MDLSEVLKNDGINMLELPGGPLEVREILELDEQQYFEWCNDGAFAAATLMLMTGSDPMGTFRQCIMSGFMAGFIACRIHVRNGGSLEKEN